MNDDVVWLTYDELADRLGIERESARTLVKRKRWGRQPGNDGKVRIGVPVDHLGPGTAPGTDPGTDPGSDPGTDPVHVPDHVPAVLEVLTRHVERLEGQLEAALSRAADRDAVATERDVLATQLEALRAALAMAEDDRGRWYECAGKALSAQDQRDTDHRAALRQAEAETAQVRAELDAWRSRPWWRRLAG